MLVCSELHPADGLCLHVVATDSGIRRIDFDPHPESGDCRRDDAHPLVAEARRQLVDYFQRKRRDFDLPLEPDGTEFQLRVWNALRAIPYGETRSYAAIARQIGAPRSVRAVGAANGRNPLPIVVPCHRVIGSNGRLVGFGGGLRVKRLLLDIEAAAPQAMLE